MQQTSVQLNQVKLPFQPDFQATAPDPSKAVVNTANGSPYPYKGSPVPRPASAFMPQTNGTVSAAPVNQSAQAMASQQTVQNAQGPLRTAVPVAPPAPVMPQRQQGYQLPMMQNMFTTLYSNGFVDLPKSFSECQELSAYIAKSELVPPALRNRQESVFVLIARASTLGISWPNIFSAFFVISDNKGNCTVGMYVKAKAAICARFGKWDVSVNMQTGDAFAQGVRFDNGHQLSITYSAYEAGLLGKLGRDDNGAIIGLGNWGPRWVDMMKARVLGRFLDAMFPDIIGGFISKEDYDDRAYAAALEAEKEQEKAAEPAETPAQDAANQITKMRKGRSKSKAAKDSATTVAISNEDTPQSKPALNSAQHDSAMQSLDDLVIEENPLA